MKMSRAAAVQENSKRDAVKAPALEEAAPVIVSLKKSPQKGPGGKWLQESLLHKRMGPFE
ncbi:hypothetical protein GJ744_008986 [Endocarpon pusillum]|uniref:Uncharacterized protein n=1 Tax=Endocarpon pusillum TaxID=364733 RepID=A0A8H7AIG3_9EURO|nr:hypothetical protein GJ744_008986 [Endocarpon pusillum]